MIKQQTKRKYNRKEPTSITDLQEPHFGQAYAEFRGVKYVCERFTLTLPGECTAKNKRKLAWKVFNFIPE